jgi:hypothetical protein
VHERQIDHVLVVFQVPAMIHVLQGQHPILVIGQVDDLIIEFELLGRFVTIQQVGFLDNARDGHRGLAVERLELQGGDPAIIGRFQVDGHDVGGLVRTIRRGLAGGLGGVLVVSAEQHFSFLVCFDLFAEKFCGLLSWGGIQFGLRCYGRGILKQSPSKQMSRNEPPAGCVPNDTRLTTRRVAEIVLTKVERESMQSSAIE